MAPTLQPNLRRLRACLEVYEQRSIQRAAQRLFLADSSLSRAVQEVERELGAALFERARRAMMPTRVADLLAGRVRRALAHLAAAEAELANAGLGRRPAVPGLAGRMTPRHLAALTGIADHHTETSAARQLAVTQSAIALALRELEGGVGEPLFVRSPRGMVPTVAGEILVRRTKLALAEVRAAVDDIASHLGTVSGRVVVGVLPLSGVLLAPRAIDRLVHEFPAMQVTIVDGTYRALEEGLLCGDVDVIVGALSFPVPPEIRAERLFEDVLCVAVRRGHPLASRPALALHEITQGGHEWVVPRRGTPARRLFDQALATARLELASSVIETNSLTSIRALLMQTDRLGVISRHQVHIEQQAGTLAVLPVCLPAPRIPVGWRMRADAVPTAGAGAFIRHLVQTVAELG